MDVDELLRVLLDDYLEDGALREYWTRPEYREALRGQAALERKIEAAMGGPFLEEYMDAAHAVAELSRRAYFQCSFRLGAQLMLLATRPRA